MEPAPVLKLAVPRATSYATAIQANRPPSSTTFARCWLPRLGSVLALIAALQILGGHWAVLQSIAWVNMMLDFSAHESLTVAIDKTFDGSHPCDLCKVVTKGRTEEQKSTSANLLVKIEAILAGTLVVPSPVDHPWSYAPFAPVTLSLAISPPTPPPLA
jgi:hypothetical protein